MMAAKLQPRLLHAPGLRRIEKAGAALSLRKGNYSALLDVPRAINGQERYPRAGKGARSTRYRQGSEQLPQCQE